MKTAVVALSLCLMMSTVTAMTLWRDNAVLRAELDNRRLVTKDQLAAVAGACEDLVDVNRRCLAFSARIKEMVDVRKDSGDKGWDDEVRRVALGLDQGGAGR